MHKKEQKQERFMALAALTAWEDLLPEDCPPDESLAELIDDRLSPSNREMIFGHLAVCPECYRRWLESASFLEPELLAREVDELRRQTVRLGARISSLEAKRLDKELRGRLKIIDPPEAEVEAQGAEKAYVQCPWCGSRGWVLKSAGWIECENCGGAFNL